MRFVTTWWVDTQKQQAIPEEGTLLALWRNGEMGVLPWDFDFDLKFYSSSTDGNYAKHNFLKKLQEVLNVTFSPPVDNKHNGDMGHFVPTAETVDYRPVFVSSPHTSWPQKRDILQSLEVWNFNGCGVDNYFLIRIPSIMHHIGDIYHQHQVPAENSPWKIAKLFGLKRKLSVSPDHMEHVYFETYSGPVEKIFGDHGSPLQCFSEGHNACLPDCVSQPVQGCEFEDNFVHVDTWDPPESEVWFWPMPRAA